MSGLSIISCQEDGVNGEGARKNNG